MSDAPLREALARWGWTDASCAFVAGRENRVYRVRSGSFEAALRLRRPGYRSRTEIMSELEWMAALADAGITVPAPVASSGGRWVEEMEGTLADAVTWLDGIPLGVTGKPLRMADRAGTFARLGCALARVHAASDAWRPPSGFQRTAWDRDGLLGDAPVWGRFWENPHLDTETRDLLVAFRRAASDDLDALEAPDFGLIHADPVRENVLLHGDEVRLIDFDDGGFGYRLFDCATALAKNRHEPDLAHLRAALLDGYRSERPLDDTALPLFLALRAATYLGWIVPRMGEPGARERLSRFVGDARHWCGAYLDGR